MSKEITLVIPELRKWRAISWRPGDRDGRRQIADLRAALKGVGIASKIREVNPSWLTNEEVLHRHLNEYDEEDRQVVYERLTTVVLWVPEQHQEQAREFCRGFTASMKIRHDPRNFAAGVAAGVYLRSHEPQRHLPKSDSLKCKRLTPGDR